MFTLMFTLFDTYSVNTQYLARFLPVSTLSALSDKYESEHDEYRLLNAFREGL